MQLNLLHLGFIIRSKIHYTLIDVIDFGFGRSTQMYMPTREVAPLRRRKIALVYLRVPLDRAPQATLSMAGR
jgi:hypothetical protein